MIIPKYAVKFRAAAFVFIVVLVMAGSTSYMGMPREGAPDVTVPFVTVMAPYEGMAPSEMENLVTIPLEKQFNDLPNVKEISSSSMEGMCVISIEFTTDQDIDEALQKVKDKIDMAKPDLPDDLDEPTVDDLNVSTDIPILTFTLSGDPSLERLDNIAQELEDLIENVPGVRQAGVSGSLEREVRIEVDLNRLISYRIPVSAFSAILLGENATVSAGNLDTASGQKYQVRVPGEFTHVHEIKDLVLGIRGGQPVYLSDVSTVIDTYKDRASITRVNREPCVTVSVMKRAGENSIAIIDSVKEILAGYQLPDGIKLTLTEDQSKDIRMMLAELENNVAAGFILVVLVLIFFMGGRNSLMVALAIPFSMLMSFIVLSLLGITLNMVVLVSLVLALGMLVDNAIVIVENIYRHYNDGENRIEAAVNGASEVAWPVITSTLTTLLAFSPLLFWPDIMGDFMSYLPKTLICTLIASLIVALVINPAICSVAVTRKKKVAVEKPTWFLDGYERLLSAALQHRGAVMALSMVAFFLTVGVFRHLGRGVELFPDIQPVSCSIMIEYPEGTDIDKTDMTVRAIEEQLNAYGDIEYVMANVGSSGNMFGGGASGTHVASVNVRFVDFHDRSESSLDIVNRIRDEMPLFPGAIVKVEKMEEGPPTGDPVTIEISGDDLDTLARLASRIKAAIKDVPGVVDLRDDIELSRSEFQFHVDRQRAALLGVDTRVVGNFLRSAVQGETPSKFRAGEDEYDITIRLPEDQRASYELFDQLRVVSRSGALVPLSSLGRAELAGGKGAIQRKNQSRAVTISANNQEREVDVILADVREIVSRIDLPRGYSVRYRGKTEDMNESSAFLKRAFGIALALIAVVLVIQFNSALLPGIILLSVLLSLVGVMWGLMLCRMRFGVIMTGIGVISLAGVVVNNAIVLIDCIHHRVAAGLSVRDAVIAGGRLRLRPVLLTAATTILGLIPMATGVSLEIHRIPWAITTGSETTEWWAPMAVAIIFGLAVATMLTLVLVPVMYSLIDSFVQALRRLVGLGSEHAS